MLAILTIRAPNDRSSLSYLAMAFGFFGRMSLGDIKGPFEEIIEIVRIARLFIKEFQGKAAGKEDWPEDTADVLAI